MGCVLQVHVPLKQVAGSRFGISFAGADLLVTAGDGEVDGDGDGSDNNESNNDQGNDEDENDARDETDDHVNGDDHIHDGDLIFLIGLTKLKAEFFQFVRLDILH